MTDILTSYDNLQDLKKALILANINPVSFLATDFLNHYNEFIMQVDMIQDFPDIYKECLNWKPLTYKQHFEFSNFTNKDMAMEAYDIAPVIYRKGLDELIKKIDSLALFLIKHIDKASETENIPEIIRICALVSPDIKDLISKASAIINGDRKTLRQKEIDREF